MMDTQGKINSFNPTGKHLYKTKTPAMSTMRRPPVERSDTPSIGDGFSSRGPRMEPPPVIQSPTRYRGGQRKWPAQVASSTLPDSQISIQPHGGLALPLNSDNAWPADNPETADIWKRSSPAAPTCIIF